MGYSPWGYKESDMTEQASTHTPYAIYIYIYIYIYATVPAGKSYILAIVDLQYYISFRCAAE